MSELNELLRDEAENAESNKDAPANSATRVIRGKGRVKVYSVRLSDDEVGELEAAARRAGVPASTLARMWITERLAKDDGTTDLNAMAQTLEAFSKRLAALH